MSPTSEGFSQTARETSAVHSPGLLLLGVMATSMAGLIIELALTRLFSVLFHYHFAFMAISVALLGLGAGGLLSYWIVGDKPLEVLWPKLAMLSGINVIVTIVTLAIVLHTDLSLTTINAQT